MSLSGKVVSLCDFDICAEEESPELGYAASMSFSRSAYQNVLEMHQQVGLAIWFQPKNEK